MINTLINKIRGNHNHNELSFGNITTEFLGASFFIFNSLCAPKCKQKCMSKDKDKSIEKEYFVKLNNVIRHLLKNPQILPVGWIEILQGLLG